MAGPLLLQNNLLYHIRSCSHQWLEFTLPSHCQSRCQRISFFALSKTPLFHPSSASWLHWTDHVAAKCPSCPPLGLEHHWGVKVQTLGQKTAFTHRLLLSTVVLFAFYGSQHCVQRSFGFSWVKAEGRLLPMGFGLAMWHCSSCPRDALGESNILFQVQKSAKDLILDNWLSSAKFVLYYYISEIF